MDRAHVGVAARGQLDDRGVDERAEAAEEQEREIGTGARHEPMLRTRLDTDNQVVYNFDN